MTGGAGVVFFDNDVLSLLAGAGLVSHTLTVLGISAAQAYRLESLSYMLQRRRIGRSWSNQTRTIALQEVQRIQVWRGQPDPQLTQRLIEIDGIDDGEAFILASLAEDSSLVMVSGDKRSMIALSEAPGIQDIREAVSGRVICLEQILNGLVSDHGAPTIGQAFAPVAAHKTIQIVFSATHMADEEQCRFAINSYYRDLTIVVGESFFFEMRRSTQ